MKSRHTTLQLLEKADSVLNCPVCTFPNCGFGKGTIGEDVLIIRGDTGKIFDSAEGSF